jgi:DNA-binding transcriptional ArsR family regulator
MIHELSIRPLNLNQLAERLSVDYRTVMHHADVLKGNSLVMTEGEKYGSMYFLSPRLKAGFTMFVQICTELRFKLEKSDP